MAERRLFKEYNQLSKNPPHLTNHQILRLSPIDPSSNVFEWESIIAKSSKEDSKYYYNGQWKILITVGEKYPIQPPSIKFSRETPINHPNINFETGEICLDILKQENWSPAWNLKYLVVAILMLIDDPEPDSPLNLDSANLFRHDKVAFESFVQYTIWKYNTFYDGDKRDSTVRARHPSGIKVIEGYSIDSLTSSTIDVSAEATQAIHQAEDEANQLAKDTASVLANLGTANNKVSPDR